MKRLWKNNIVWFCFALPLLLLQCMDKQHVHDEVVYTCPMHPSVESKHPGKCPICGMDLVKKDNATAGPLDSSTAAMARHTSDMRESAIESITPELKTMELTIDAQGIVTYDTRFVYIVPSRVAGRLEGVSVKYEYQLFKKGQKLVDVYSPELVAAQREYLYLMDHNTDTQLLDAAKRKLIVLGFSEKQLDALERSREATYRSSIYSPYSGYIVSTTSAAPEINSGSQSNTGSMSSMSATSTKEPESAAISDRALRDEVIREGEYVTAGQPLVKVVSNEALRIELNLSSSYTSLIKKGEQVNLNFGNGHAHSATIDFVEPYFSEGQEFLKVRVYTTGMQNMHIGHLVDATINVSTKESLWVPRSSVVNLGVDQVVFTKQGDTFQPKKVSAGVMTADLVQIRSGLTIKDSVARNASYLVDSEGFIKLKQP